MACLPVTAAKKMTVNIPHTANPLPFCLDQKQHLRDSTICFFSDEFVCLFHFADWLSADLHA